MAAASGLLSPTLVKIALRSISEEREITSGSSSLLSDLQEEAEGRRFFPRSSAPSVPPPAAQQETAGYIPLAARRVREVCRRRPRQTAVTKVSR